VSVSSQPHEHFRAALEIDDIVLTRTILDLNAVHDIMNRLPAMLNARLRGKVAGDGDGRAPHHRVGQDFHVDLHSGGLLSVHR
jgi:hypothetical protein